jgi:hypothetical protein
MSAYRSRTRFITRSLLFSFRLFSTQSIFPRQRSVSVVAAAGSAGLRRLKTGGQTSCPAWRSEISAGDYAERLRRFCRDCGGDTPHEGSDELGGGWYPETYRCQYCLGARREDLACCLVVNAHCIDPYESPNTRSEVNRCRKAGAGVSPGTELAGAQPATRGCPPERGALIERLRRRQGQLMARNQSANPSGICPELNVYRSSPLGPHDMRS